LVDAGAAPGIIDAVFRSDEPFPEYLPFWTENWSLKDALGDTTQYAARDMPLGGGVHLYLCNPGGDSPPVQDVFVEGISLSRAVAPGERTIHDMHPTSLFFSGLPETDVIRREGTAAA